MMWLRHPSGISKSYTVHTLTRYLFTNLLPRDFCNTSILLEHTYLVCTHVINKEPFKRRAVTQRGNCVRRRCRRNLWGHPGREQLDCWRWKIYNNYRLIAANAIPSAYVLYIRQYVYNTYYICGHCLCRMETLRKLAVRSVTKRQKRAVLEKLFRTGGRAGGGGCGGGGAGKSAAMS